MAIKRLYINNNLYKLEIKNSDKNNFLITMNNKEVTVIKKSEEHTQSSRKASTGTASVGTFNVSEENNNILLEINGKLYKAKKIKQTKYYTEIYIYNFNTSFKIQNKHKSKIIPARLANTNNVFKNKLFAPIPGKVITVHCKPNDFVKKNQTLITIESMKMENEIKAFTDCFIKNIQITKLDLVRQDDVLIIFSKKGENSRGTKNKNGPT